MKISYVDESAPIRLTNLLESVSGDDNRIIDKLVTQIWGEFEKTDLSNVAFDDQMTMICNDRGLPIGDPDDDDNQEVVDAEMNRLMEEDPEIMSIMDSAKKEFLDELIARARQMFTNKRIGNAHSRD